MLLQDNPSAITMLIKSLSSNKYLEDIRIGDLFMKVNFYLDGIVNKWAIVDHSISAPVKESLINCIDLVPSKEDSAQIMLSTMAR